MFPPFSLPGIIKRFTEASAFPLFRLAGPWELPGVDERPRPSPQRGWGYTGYERYSLFLRCPYFFPWISSDTPFFPKFSAAPPIRAHDFFFSFVPVGPLYQMKIAQSLKPQPTHKMYPG